MLRSPLVCSIVIVSLASGCGGSAKPGSQATGPAKSANVAEQQTSIAVTEPDLESVPPQTEPGDADFPRGAEAFAALVKAAESNDAEGWTKAEARLHELGAQATAALSERLSDERPVARELAAMFLAQIGPDASPAAEKLLTLLEDDSSFARVNAAAALSTFDGYAPQIVPVLTQLLFDADDNVRLTAATSLRNVGPSASKSVSGLAQILNDPNPQVRAAAATTLGEIGPVAIRTVSALRQLQSDPDEAVVAAASRAIRQIDESSVDKTTLATPASATE